MVRQKLNKIIEAIDFGSIRLRQLFNFTVDEAIEFLANAGLLQNEMECDTCGNLMNIQKRGDSNDGIQWVCRGNKKRCSRKSIRSKSIFEKSNLKLPHLLQIIYMWVYDFDCKHISRELELNKNTVVDWTNLCREVCQHYCNNQEQLGGEGKYVEIDETCIAKQKHHRGKPKKGASQWVFGGIERGKGGLMFAFRVPDRTKKTLYPLIRKYIKDGTTIISDDWPSYRQLGKKFGKPFGYTHYVICHKKHFARTVEENGQDLRVHTNKSEGSWSHLKHKIKRIYGTQNHLLGSYVAEAVFRQNCRAKQWNVLEKFIQQVTEVYFN